MSGSPENPSRREFLKTAAMGGVFLGELMVSGPARAALEELFGSQEYRNETIEELIGRLERSVYESATELMWAHVEKEGKQYTVNIVHDATDRSVNGINLTPLYQDHAISRASLLHTHPAALFLADPKFPREKAEEILRQRTTNIPRLPSVGDLIQYMADKVRLEEMNLKRSIAHYVIEPSGVWSYDVDMEHPMIKESLSREDRDTRAEMVLNSKSLMMSLGHQLEKWSRKFESEDSAIPELLVEFTAWAKKEYGITFNYRKTDHAL